MVLLSSGDELNGPIALQSDGVEEAQRAHGDYSRPYRYLPLVGQVDLIGANLFGAQLFWRLAKMPGEETDLAQVALLRVECEVAHPHVLCHPLAQGRDLADGWNGIPKGRYLVAHVEQRYRNSRTRRSRILIYRSKTY